MYPFSQPHNKESKRRRFSTGCPYLRPRIVFSGTKQNPYPRMYLVAVHHNFFTVTGTLSPAEPREDNIAIRRRRALKRVDRELSRGNSNGALSLVKQLQGKPYGLRGFGAAKKVPKRLTSLDEFALNGEDLLSLQSLVDSVVDSIKRCIQFAALDEESMIPDEEDESLCEEDHFRCTQHEAGHFLVGYLLGVLPKENKIARMKAPRQDKYAAGRIRFVGLEFLEQVPNADILKKNTELCDGEDFTVR